MILEKFNKIIPNFSKMKNSKKSEVNVIYITLEPMYSFLSLFGLRGFSINQQQQPIQLTKSTQIYSISLMMILVSIFLWCLFQRFSIRYTDGLTIFETIATAINITNVGIQLITPVIQKINYLKIIENFYEIDKKLLLIMNLKYYKKLSRFSLASMNTIIFTFILIIFVREIARFYAHIDYDIKYYIIDYIFLFITFINLIQFFNYLYILAYRFDFVNRKLPIILGIHNFKKYYNHSSSLNTTRSIHVISKDERSTPSINWSG